MQVLHFSIEAYHIYNLMSEDMSEETHDTVTIKDIVRFIKELDLTSDFIDKYEDEDDSYDFKYESIVEVRDEDDNCSNVYDEMLPYHILNDFRAVTRTGYYHVYR